MKRQFSRIFLVSLLGLWITFWCTLPIAADSTQVLPSEAQKEFKKFLVEQMALDKVPGLSVGFLKGKIIWTKAFGFSDLENKVQAKPESSYRLASITKTITAIAVLQLVEKMKEIFALADIAMELYPKDAELHKNVADIYLNSGLKTRAIHFYKKALEIDPKLEATKKILERLEKEKKK